MFRKEDNAEFNIKDSWTVNKSLKTYDKEKHTENSSLPSNNNNNLSNNAIIRKGSNKDLNTILNNAGKLAVGNNNLENLLDDNLAKNIVKNLMQENNISYFYNYYKLW